MKNKKILFTTFTKNLSLDILENLKKICDEKTMQNIEVINLDSWVHNFLSKHGYKNEKHEKPYTFLRYFAGHRCSSLFTLPNGE